MGKVDRIEPLSYLQADAGRAVREVTDGNGPLILTEDGEARAVLMDIASYSATVERLRLLEVVLRSERERAEGRVMSLTQFTDRFRQKYPDIDAAE